MENVYRSADAIPELLAVAQEEYLGGDTHAWFKVADVYDGRRSCEEVACITLITQRDLPKGTRIYIGGWANIRMLVASTTSREFAFELLPNPTVLDESEMN